MKTQRLVRIMMIPLIVLIGLMAFQPGSVYAQPLLVDAFPGPDQVIDFAPDGLRLTFDRAVDTDGLWVDVTNGAGETMVAGSPEVSRSNRARVDTPLQPLPDGIYNVSYRVAAVGGSVAIRGEYSFTVDLPVPKLYLLEPIDGANTDTGPVELLMRIESVSFEYYDTRIAVYLDGEKLDEIQKIEYTIPDLDPGVHEIAVVLVQFDEELSQTEDLIHLAVHEPIPEPGELPKRGYDPEPTEWALVVIISMAIIVGGYFLGRKTRHLSAGEDVEDGGGE